MQDQHTVSLHSSGSNPPEGTPPGTAPDSPLEDRLRDALGDDYRLGPQIGEGGMGVVFRATDLRLKREVAIKVLPPEVAYRADLRKRFVREAQLAASLSHPNIVSIHDVGQRRGLVWIVMTLIHGESVRDMIRRLGPQPVHIAAQIMRETAYALSYAHARGIIHRDVKPDNILIERGSGRAIVMDFGLAKFESDDENLTHPGGVLGTPAYMSPEQARGKENIDHRSDIFSVGLVGYYVLTGRNPFEAANARAVMARIINEPAPSISNARPDAPAWLADAITKATERMPEKRYDRAEDMAEALDRANTAQEIPTSIQYLLVWMEAYVELSVLAAWFIFIVGVPVMPKGSGLILACLLSLPILLSIQLVNAEGLRWSDIREGIVSWRLHIVRCLNIKREAGLNYPVAMIITTTVIGVITVRWLNTILSFLANKTGPWTAWTPLDPGPAGDNSFLMSGPPWAFWYAIFGSLLWARVLGLPPVRRISPQRIDKVANWRMPRWLDRLGAILFAKVFSSSRIVPGAADFRQLAEPSVQAAIAFNRTKRSMRIRDRLRMWYPIFLADRVVWRLWHTQERLRMLRDGLADGRGSDSVNRSISERENILTECAAALGDLRLALEEAGSTEPSDEPPDARYIAELHRLSAPPRRIMLGSFIFSGVWIATLVIRITLIRDHSGLGQLFDNAIFYGLLMFVAFQFLKRRLVA